MWLGRSFPERRQVRIRNTTAADLASVGDPVRFLVATDKRKDAKRSGEQWSKRSSLSECSGRFLSRCSRRYLGFLRRTLSVGGLTPEAFR